MTASEIAAALGAARRAGQWWSCRCPAHDDRTPSLSLRDGNRGVIIRCWAGCDPRDVRAELRRRGLLTGCNADAPPTAGRYGDNRDDAAGCVELARRIWRAARDAAGSPVARYLTSRGITFAPPPSLRWAPSLLRRDGIAAPAMVARIDSIDGEFIGICRTWLNRGPDGIWRRRDRAMLGRAAGGAVRLVPLAETLMVAEGIETGMAAMTATEMPAWAALSTAGLVALALPPSVRTVIILADHDANGAGERAAHAAAARWLAEGRRVRLALPPQLGTDFNDVLMGRHRAEMRDAAT